jgi:MFS family permease
MSHRIRPRLARTYYLLWSARTISFSGDTIAQVALVILAARQADAALAVSQLLLAQTLPQLLGPMAGLLADRVERRGLMLGCELGQAVLVAAIALLAFPFAAALVLIAAMSLLATLFLPAGQSALPALVPTEALTDANALLRLGFNISRAAGPLFAGLLLTHTGIPAVLLLDALTFVVSALLLRRLPSLPPAAPTDHAIDQAPRERVVAATRAGLSYLARCPTAAAVTAGLFLVTLFVALDNVGLVFLAQHTFAASATGYGLLLAGYGVGMVMGPLILLRLAHWTAPRASLLLGIGIMGVGTALCGLAPSLAVAVAFQVIVGVGNGLQNIANDTLLQQSVPRPLLGRVFGVAYSVPYAALLLTYVAGGALLQLTSPRFVFVLAGLGTLGALLVVYRLLPRPKRRGSLT